MMEAGAQGQQPQERPSGGWVAFERESGRNSREGVASNPFRGDNAAAPGNPFACEGLNTGPGNPFYDDESAFPLEKQSGNASAVAPAAAASAAATATGAPSPPVCHAARSSASPPGALAPTLPPTVAAAAAAAAALGGAAAPDAKAGQPQGIISQGTHQNLDQLLKELQHGSEGTEQVPSGEAAELARIQRIRESWRGLVAPKAQRCSREGSEASGRTSQSGTPAASLRERAILVNPRPRTSLELRMAAAEALHVARRASPTPESLFGVEEHLVQGSRPPSAPMSTMPHFPSPGPWDSSHCRQQHSASVPMQSPQLSFLGDAEQQQLLQHQQRVHAHDMMWHSQPQMQGSGVAAAFQGLPDGTAPTGQRAGGEGLCAYDAAGSALELRMAAAEAMAVTQRAAWEQQQQEEHDARMERDRTLLAKSGLPARMPWEVETNISREASTMEVNLLPAVPTPLAQAAASPAGPSPAATHTATLPQPTAASSPLLQQVAAPPPSTRLPQRAPPPPCIPTHAGPPPPSSPFSPPLAMPLSSSAPPPSFPSPTAAYAQPASFVSRPTPPSKFSPLNVAPRASTSPPIPACAPPPPPPAAPFAASAAPPPSFPSPPNPHAQPAFHMSRPPSPPAAPVAASAPPPPSYEEALAYDSVGQPSLLDSEPPPSVAPTVTPANPNPFTSASPSQASPAARASNPMLADPFGTATLVRRAPPPVPARPPPAAPAPRRSNPNASFHHRAAPPPPPPPSSFGAHSALPIPAQPTLPTTAQVPQATGVATAAAAPYFAAPQSTAPYSAAQYSAATQSAASNSAGPAYTPLNPMLSNPFGTATLGRHELPPALPARSPNAASPPALRAPPSSPLVAQQQQQQQPLLNRQGSNVDQGLSVSSHAPQPQRRAPPPPPSHAQPRRAAPPPPLSTVPATPMGQTSPSHLSPASSFPKSPPSQSDLQHNPFLQQNPFVQLDLFTAQQNPFLQQEFAQSNPFAAQQNREAEAFAAARQQNPFLDPPTASAPFGAARPLVASPGNMSSISTAAHPTSPPGAEQRPRDEERHTLRQEKKQPKQQLLPPQELSSPIKPTSPHSLSPKTSQQQEQQQQQPPRPRRQAPPPPPHRPPPPAPPTPQQQQQQQQQPTQASAILTPPINDGLPPSMGRPPIPNSTSLPPGPRHKHKKSRSIGSMPTLSPTSSGGVFQGEKDAGAQGALLYIDPANSCRDALCVEVRLPPMTMVKEAAGPKLLATGLGNLFCMPGPPGQAMLNWAEVHGHLGLPHGNIHAAQEDLDSTPCAAVTMPDPGCEKATSVHVDELAAAMWTGHKNGKVCRWSLGQSQGTRCEQVWLAHREHKVVALAVTPWGELWTGSTYGTIRVWACNLPGSNLRTPAKVFDVMRQNGDRPHSKLYSLACCSSGRTLWSLGRNQILLWDTYTGTNVGALRISGEGPVGVVDLEARQVWIDPAKGLDPSTMRRSFRMRTPPKGAAAEEDSSADEEEMSVHDAMKGDRSVAWGAKLTKGVGNVGKFAARMGKRTTQLAASVPQRFGRHVRTRSNGETYVLDGADPLGVEASGGSKENLPGPAEDPAQGDKGKGCALVATLDGHMIVAYKSGLVEKYTELGKRVWATRVTTQAAHLHCALLVARILWLGCSDGCIRLVDAGSGRPHMQWRAHMLSVKSLAAMGTTVFSLAKDGSIRGWPAVQPPPPAAVHAWKEGARLSLRRHQLRAVAGTWNVNSTRPCLRSIYDWLGCHAEPHEGVDLVCVGLQEVEMGTSSVATDAVRNIINRAALEKGNANAQWWSDQLLSALGGPEVFTRVALRQMSGILMITFCRNTLVPHVGEVATSSVACGLLGVAGNKGAAAISLSLYRRRVILLSSHFAAHLEKLEERNADYTRIMRCLRFDNTSATASTNPKASAGGQMGPFSAEDDTLAVECAEVPQPGFSSSAESMSPGLSDAEVVIWMGDFNYRLSSTYEWAVSRAETGAFAELLTVDQLRTEMGRGAIFHSLSEGPLCFPPTYKFDKGVPASELRPLPYDSSDKKRVPAWTDRIFWRGSLPPLPGSSAASSHEEDVQVTLLTDGLDAAAGSSLTPATGARGLRRSSSSSSSGALANLWGGAGSSLSALAYGAAMGVCDSDHKPVWCKLQLQVPAHAQQQKRRMSEQILNDVRKELCPRIAPRLTLHIESTQPIMSHQVPDDVPTLVLKRDEVEEVLIQNPGPAPVLMSAIGEGRRLPLWLEVQPTSCLVPPRGSVRIILQAAAPDRTCQGLGGGAAALRAQEVMLRVYGQHLTSLGRGSGQPSHPLHFRSQSETMQPLLLRVQSLYY